MMTAVDVQFQETFYGETMFLQGITKHTFIENTQSCLLYNLSYKELIC